MSGGSFNYLCFKVEHSDEILSFEVSENLEKMERYLRSINRHEAANEIYSFILTLKTYRNRLLVIGERIAPLLQAVEWECSGDSGKDLIDNEYEKLLGGKVETP